MDPFTSPVCPDDVLDRFGIRTPPVDIVALATGLGIEVWTVNGAQWDGAIDRGPPPRIYVDGGGTPTRQRFVVAHALGHWFLHPERRAFRDRFHRQKGLNLYELQANRFAAGLLMPTHWVMAYGRYETGDALARRFGVSRGALSVWMPDYG